MMGPRRAARGGLVATGGAGWWQVLISMLIAVATTVVMTRVAALIFRRAILRTGTRLRLRAVLRGEGGTADPVGAAAAGPTR